MLKLKVTFGKGSMPLYFIFTTDKTLPKGELEKGTVRTINKHSDWGRSDCGAYLFEHYREDMAGFQSIVFVK